jgi:hypothetical protein
LFIASFGVDLYHKKDSAVSAGNNQDFAALHYAVKDSDEFADAFTQIAKNGYVANQKFFQEKMIR